jgi:hypothetical protein
MWTIVARRIVMEAISAIQPWYKTWNINVKDAFRKFKRVVN